MLIKHIKEKHVMLSMSNGQLIEGFVQSFDESFLRLIGNDNSESIVRVDDISVAKVGLKEYLNEEAAVDIPRQHYPAANANDFSVLAGVGNDSYVKPTELVRQTPRHGEE